MEKGLSSCFDKSKIYVKRVQDRVDRARRKYKFLTADPIDNDIVVYPEDMSIGADPGSRMWSWLTFENGMRQAELATPVTYLHVEGSVDEMSVFSRRRKYEVVLEAELKQGASGWQNPVTVSFSVVDTNGTITHTKSHNLSTKQKGFPFELNLGELRPKVTTGKLTFSLSQQDQQHKKHGLIIRKLVIRVKSRF